MADVATLGVLHVRARLDVEVPDGCRSAEALADLAHADSAAAWTTALARAGSNHQVLEPLDGEVRFGGRVVPPGTTCRVDQRPFGLGPYDVQLGTSTDDAAGPPLDDPAWEQAMAPTPDPARG